VSRAGFFNREDEHEQDPGRSPDSTTARPAEQRPKTLDFVGRHGRVLKATWDWVQAAGLASKLPVEWWVFGTPDMGAHSLDAFPKTDKKGVDAIVSVSVAPGPGNEAKRNFRATLFFQAPKSAFEAVGWNACRNSYRG
jgi:hypothetical protein